MNKDSSDVKSLLRLARMHFNRGALEEAEIVLKQAARANPDVVDIWHLLGNVYYQMGRHSEEKEAFRRVLELDEYHEAAATDLAATLVEEGSFREAEELLRRAIKKNPLNYLGWMNLGKALLAQGCIGEGEEALKKVIELRPDHVNAHFRLGKLYREMGDHKLAEGAFRKVVEYKPETADAWIELGLALMHNGLHEEAEAAWQTAIKYDPNNDAPWVNLAVNMITSGRCDEATKYLSKAHQLAPQDEYVRRATMLYKTMCKGESRTYSLSADITELDNPEKKKYIELINLAAVLSSNNHLEEAEDAYRRAIDIDKTDPLGWGGLASNLVYQHRLNESKEAFNEYFKLDNGINPQIHLAYATLLRELNRDDEAISVLLKVIREYPTFAYAWFNLGNLYMRKCDWKQALEMYITAQEKNPDSKLKVKVLWNRGVALKEMGRYYEAQESLLDALKIDPQNSGVKAVLEQVRALITMQYSVEITGPFGPIRISSAGGKMRISGEDLDLEYAQSDLKKLSYETNQADLKRRESQLLSEAYQLLYEGMLDEAFVIAGQLEQTDPLLVETLKAGVFVKKGMYTKALEVMDRVLKNHPNHSEGYIIRGKALVGLGRLSEAESSMQRALELNPTEFENISQIYDDIQANGVFALGEQAEKNLAPMTESMKKGKAQGSSNKTKSTCPHCSAEISISGIMKPDGSVICPKCFKRFKPDSH